MPESFRLIAAALLFVAAIYFVVRGSLRRLQHSWSIKAQLYQARHSTVAVLLFAAAIGVYYQNSAAALIVPPILFVIWIEYWLVRR